MTEFGPWIPAILAVAAVLVAAGRLSSKITRLETETAEMRRQLSEMLGKVNRRDGICEERGKVCPARALLAGPGSEPQAAT